MLPLKKILSCAASASGFGVPALLPYSSRSAANSPSTELTVIVSPPAPVTMVSEDGFWPASAAAGFRMM